MSNNLEENIDGRATAGDTSRTDSLLTGENSHLNFPQSVFRPTPNAIEIKNVTKHYKKGNFLRRQKTTAVDGVSFAIEEGELFGLLGPNGAGKTTLVRCISTLLIPDQGEITIFGKNIFRHPLVVRRQLGLLTSGERTLYWKLSGRDNLNYFAALYGMERKVKERRIGFLFELLGLNDFADERVERYSSGMRQKLSLALALLHDPKVLLFDEPTLGLDPQFARFIRGFIREELNRKQGKTILLTTHYMDEADELCDRIAFITAGRIVQINTPAYYKREIPHKEIIGVRVAGRIDVEPIRRLATVEQVSAHSQDGVWQLRIRTGKGEGILADLIELLRREAKILSINLEEPTLEDVFIYITGRSLRDEG